MASHKPTNRLGNSLPIFVLPVLAVWMAYIRYYPTHLPVGTYIGVLAFVAAVVTIWPPDNAWSKAAWLIIFGAFLVFEIRTLYEQRGEDQQTDRDKTKEENNRFAGLLKVQQDNFTGVLKQQQREFEVTMGEVRGSPGYVWFLALARTEGELPVMMGNDNKVPIRGVDLEIINIPPRGSADEWQQIANNVFNPRLVHIGDVSPGFKQAPFTLAPGRYDIRIITRLGMFDERLEAVRGPSVPHGWHEEYCVLKNNSSKVLKGECPH